MYDSKEIYDVNSMRDRMAGIAYTNGVNGGLDTNVAGMVSVALDVGAFSIRSAGDEANQEAVYLSRSTCETSSRVCLE